MSQYPSPYNVPSSNQYGGYQPWPDLLAPARRAGWLMVSIGSLSLLCGMCVGAVAFALPSMIAQMPAEQTEPIRRIESEYNVSARLLFGALAALSLIVAVLYIVLGIFTRGGKRGWVVASLILGGLSLLYCLFNLVVAAMSGPAGLGGVCFSAAAAGVLILLFVWLVGAMRASGRLAQMQAQYQSGFWPGQYPQQPPYGYGGYDPNAYQQGWYPPPPPPPTPPAAGLSDSNVDRP